MATSFSKLNVQALFSAPLLPLPPLDALAETQMSGSHPATQGTPSGDHSPGWVRSMVRYGCCANAAIRRQKAEPLLAIPLPSLW